MTTLDYVIIGGLASLVLSVFAKNWWRHFFTCISLLSIFWTLIHYIHGMTTFIVVKMIAPMHV